MASDLQDPDFILESSKAVLLAQCVTMVTGVNHYKTFLNTGEGFKVVKVKLL